MTQEHNFKAALEAYNTKEIYCSGPFGGDITCYHIVGDQHDETIQFALRLADRLSSGEVSDVMVHEAVNPKENYPFRCWSEQAVKENFKAMAAQMMEECK